ncbi:hypothetical protein K491DRAFT_58672 [Lophiostoma macrostomum CBS 122681]|uniref:Uncharacterized protein n=1 Tax=Lophiostoma macrostomum CBS 122681 TaxID=1314788 RepID=A0A6A6TKA8_9PLEO|nr:hypothetical protein K491DRAFT_58672 [Lophiostoma macrostomum CBS 122681]
MYCIVWSYASGSVSDIVKYDVVSVWSVGDPTMIRLVGVNSQGDEGHQTSACSCITTLQPGTSLCQTPKHPAYYFFDNLSYLPKPKLRRLTHHCSLTGWSGAPDICYISLRLVVHPIIPRTHIPRSCVLSCFYSLVLTRCNSTKSMILETTKVGFTIHQY